MKVSEALRWGTAEISASSVSDTPLLDASLILMHFTSLTRVELYTKENQLLKEKQDSAYRKAIAERREHQPIAYIIGEREFYGRDFIVTPDVLIPRRDTETAIEIALSLLPAASGEQKVLDLCTGSGCIGITLALELTTADITLSDISPEALAVARRNCVKHGLELDIVQSDLFENLNDREFTCIVTNPPYVAPSWYDECTQEVHKEPRSAIVDEADDGLSIIENIIAQSVSHLHKKGYLVIECDYRQVKAVQDLMEAAGFREVSITADMGERDRVVSGRL